MYITTPIYYVNDVPHIGHAYTSIICDVIARFMRLDNQPVQFITGTDEYGQKVAKSALKKNLSPQDFVNEVSASFINLTKVLNLSNNDFIRTTEPRHNKSAQALWQRIADNGYIYEGCYEGWYSLRDEAFYQEKELIDGKAPTGAEVEWIKEPSYFFKLSAFQEPLLQLYEQQADFIFPKSRRNEVISFVKSGLKDLSISRTSFTWGVKVPGNEKHIMYVWLDALSNYLTASGFPDVIQDTQLVHVIGKDILRFHAVYWPAFLMAADLPLPKKIIAHGWWTNEGQKISKSIGNVIDPIQLIEEFGLDQVRYFLLREMSFGNDGNFSRATMINRLNSELANNIGNLVHRVTSMIYKNCYGAIPSARHSQVISDVYKMSTIVCQYITTYQFNEALEEILKISSLGNEYIDKCAPWKLKKSDPIEMAYVLYELLEIIRCIAILLQPFIPDSANKILDQLSVPTDERKIGNVDHHYALKTNVKIPTPEVIFTKIFPTDHSSQENKLQL